MDRFKSVIPEGSTRARIRASRRESHKPKEATLASTLGEEATGMVVVDFDGHVMRYDQLTVMENVIAAPASTLEIEVPGPRGKGWRRTSSSVDTANDPELDDEWRKDLSEGARHMREETWIKASDYHYDAKCFPAVHPHGTGSLSSEPGTGGPRHYAKMRLCSIEQFFRRSALWAFWMMDRIIKTQMFWVKRKREKKRRAPRQPRLKQMRLNVSTALFSLHRFQRRHRGGDVSLRTC